MAVKTFEKAIAKTALIKIYRILEFKLSIINFFSHFYHICFDNTFYPV